MFALRPCVRLPWVRNSPSLLHEARHLTPLVPVYPLPATFATARHAIPRRKRRTGLYITAGVALLGAGYLNFTEDGRFFAGATARTGRVIGTLAVSVNEYVSFDPGYGMTRR